MKITQPIVADVNQLIRELAERLVEMRPGARVFYMSGYTADVIAHKGILDANVEYIQKPFSPNSLANLVREVSQKTWI